MLAKLSTLIILLFTSSTLLLAQPSESLIESLSSSASFRVKFTQNRQIDGFLKPIQSSGELLFIKGAALIWRLTEPELIESIIAPTGFYQVKTNRKGQPYPFKLRSNQLTIFLSKVFSSQIQEVKEIFEIIESQSEIKMKPKPEELKNKLVHVKIDLDLKALNTIRQIEIIESDRTQTLLSFSNYQFDKFQLTEAERAILAELK